MKIRELIEVLQAAEKVLGGDALEAQAIRALPLPTDKEPTP